MKPRPVLVPHQDFQGRTCLLVSRQSGQVRFIEMLTTGLAMNRCREVDFDQRFKSMGDYPTERAAQLYVQFAKDLGCTPEVMEELAKVVKLTQEQIKAATTKTVLVRSEGGELVKKAVVRGAQKSKDTASQLFQKLILEGKLNDDQIFKEVQKQFGLAENRRAYVKWYRKKLIKEGRL